MDKHTIDLDFGSGGCLVTKGPGLWEVSDGPDPEFHVTHLGFFLSYPALVTGVVLLGCISNRIKHGSVVTDSSHNLLFFSHGPVMGCHVDEGGNCGMVRT